MSIDTQTLGAPVNGTAGRVIGKGVNHDWNLRGEHACWDTPQPTREPLSNSDDYRGVVFGRMTVIGLLRDYPGRWLCRCVCGMYEPRKAKAIRNPNNSGDACLNCRTLFQRRRKAVHREFYAKHGCWPSESSGVEAQRIKREWGG